MRNLRARLVYLVLLAILPSFVLLLMFVKNQRYVAEREARESALRAGQVINNVQDVFTQNTLELLRNLAQISRVADNVLTPEICSALFGALLDANPEYLNIGVANPRGFITCSARSSFIPTTVNINNESYFRDAVMQQRFTIGGYQIARIVGKPTVNYAFPVMEGSEVTAVIFASLSLDWLNETVETLSMINAVEGAQIFVLDNQSVVMANYPSQDVLIGQSLPELLRAPFEQALTGDGMANKTDSIYGERMIFVSRLEDQVATEQIYLMLSTPRAAIYSDADTTLTASLISIGVISVIAIAAMWVGGEIFIMRQVRQIVMALQNLRDNHLETRVNIGHGEFGMISDAINDMAARLQEQFNTIQNHSTELEQRVAERTAELQTSLAKEKELNVLKARFASMISHEFRHPLSIINSSNDLLRLYRHRMTEERATEHHQLIVSQVIRLTQLLDEILFIQRADAVGISYEPVRVDVVGLMSEIVKEHRIATGDSHKISFDTDCDSLITELDPRLFRLAINNLISNAVKYSAVSSSVEINMRHPPEGLIISVKDEGIGIPPDDLTHLFEDFHRGSNVTEIKGTGVGLAVVKRVVDRHGGTIEIESTLGVGSRFSIIIPTRSPDAV